MCIIVSKAKGVEMPSKDILKRCFDYNSDGAGLMFVNKDKVNIVKGFMTFDKFYEYIEKLGKIHDLKEKALVMHFRISTGGNVDGGNCHPYPVSHIEKGLRKEYILTDLGMAHNGIISMFNYKDGVLNDTQQFIRDCVATLYDLNKDFYKDENTMNLLDKIAGSKLCFLDKDENIYYVGKFIEEDGVMYSNSTYKPYTYYPTRTNGYGYYDSYYDNIYYYDELTAKHNQKNSEKLTKSEFDFLLQNILILPAGTEVVAGNGTSFTVSKWSEGKYGIDDWFNVYYIDKYTNDLILLYEDVVDIKYGDENEEVDEWFDEIGKDAI